MLCRAVPGFPFVIVHGLAAAGHEIGDSRARHSTAQRRPAGSVACKSCLLSTACVCVCVWCAGLWGWIAGALAAAKTTAAVGTAVVGTLVATDQIRSAIVRGQSKQEASPELPTSCLFFLTIQRQNPYFSDKNRTFYAAKKSIWSYCSLFHFYF